MFDKCVRLTQLVILRKGGGLRRQQGQSRVMVITMEIMLACGYAAICHLGGYDYLNVALQSSWSKVDQPPAT